MPCSSISVDPRAFTSCFEVLVRGFDLLVDALEFTDQLDGQAASGLADEVAGSDRRDQRAGLACGQKLLRPTGEQFQQQPVQPVDGLRPGPAELVTTVDEHPHHQQVRIDLDLHQIRGAQRNHRDRMGIHRVGLAAVAGGEHPHLRRQLRRHVKHRLTVVDQPVGDVLADPVAALDRPHPIGEPAAGGEHARRSRPCRCRTCPPRAPGRVRRRPRSWPSACADPSR